MSMCAKPLFKNILTAVMVSSFLILSHSNAEEKGEVQGIIIKIQAPEVVVLGFPIFISMRIENQDRKSFLVPVLDVGKQYKGGFHCVFTTSTGKVTKLGTPGLSIGDDSFRHAIMIKLKPNQSVEFVFDAKQLWLGTQPLRDGEYSMKVEVATLSGMTPFESNSVTIKMRKPSKSERAFLKSIGSHDLRKSWFTVLAIEDGEVKISADISKECIWSANILQLLRECLVDRDVDIPVIEDFGKKYGGNGRLAARLLAEKAAIHGKKNDNITEYLHKLVKEYPYLRSVLKQTSKYEGILASLIKKKNLLIEFRREQKEKQKDEKNTLVSYFKKVESGKNIQEIENDLKLWKPIEMRAPATLDQVWRFKYETSYHYIYFAAKRKGDNSDKRKNFYYIGDFVIKEYKKY